MSNKYDFLTDVAAIELINQISVSKEKAVEIAKKNTFVGRVFNFITGDKEEHLIDFTQEVSDALESLKNEICTTNNKLLKNLQAIKQLAAAMLKHKAELTLHHTEIVELKDKIDDLSLQMMNVKAEVVMRRVIDEWELKCDLNNDVLFEAIHLVQRLYWSDFTQSAMGNAELLNAGFNACLNALTKKFNIKTSDLIRQVNLVHQFSSLPVIERDAMNLMINQIDSTLTNAYMHNDYEKLLQQSSLSRVISAENLLRNMFEGSFNKEQGI